MFRRRCHATGLSAITSSQIAIIVNFGAIMLIVYQAWKLKGRKG
jgi:predicted RND superfamily exporter protein